MSKQFSLGYDLPFKMCLMISDLNLALSVHVTMPKNNDLLRELFLSLPGTCIFNL